MPCCIFFSHDVAPFRISPLFNIFVWSLQSFFPFVLLTCSSCCLFHFFPCALFFIRKASIHLYGTHPMSVLFHQTLHFQIDASQLPGAGWWWYEQMKVGLTVLTEISNSSISALRQSKKPTAACLEAASERKKKHVDVWMYGFGCVRNSMKQ